MSSFFLCASDDGSIDTSGSLIQKWLMPLETTLNWLFIVRPETPLLKPARHHLALFCILFCCFNSVNVLLLMHFCLCLSNNDVSSKRGCTGWTELWVPAYLDSSWRHTCVRTEQVVQHTAYITQMTREQLSKKKNNRLCGSALKFMSSS